MNNFKLKVCIGNANIELEGDGDLVLKILTELRESGLGKFTSLGNNTVLEEEVYDVKALDEACNNPNNNSAKDTSEELDSENMELPVLSDFVIKGNPSTEVEWLLVYALYQSENGTKFFTKEDLRQKYRETNRYTEARSKNFITNFKNLITNNYIAAINDIDYKVTSTGKQKANEIVFSGNDGGDIKKPKRQLKSFTSDSYEIVEVGLTEEERSEFRSYFSSFKSLSNIDKAVVISYWIKENKNINEIDKDIMFTMLKTANANTSFDIKGALRNAKSLNKYYINGSEKGKYKLNHIGEDYVKELIGDKE